MGAEPYFITIQKLELKKTGGDWVTVIEPDHRVDLMSTEAVVTFFNNGRVPAADFDNFRVLFDDHGAARAISRKKDYDVPVRVKKGSFIRVSFVLDFESGADGSPVRPSRVRELDLTVDDLERADKGDTLVM